MEHLLIAVPFRDPARSRQEISHLTKYLSPGVSARAERLLAASPDPDATVAGLASLEQRQPAAFQRLVNSTAGLKYMVTVFSHSRFLSGELLQHPEWLEQLLSSGSLHRMLSREDYRYRLERFIQGGGAPDPLVLAQFRRQQILRILLRDVLAFSTLPETTEELSNLADIILEIAYQRIAKDLESRHGKPLDVDAAGKIVDCGFAVIALGKLGGAELNYSSDIDLMFIYRGNGQTTGPSPISNKEFYKKVANQLTDLLSIYTAEGLCYRVDLRLRPDGRLGEVCLSLDGTKAYYQKRARDWELQMLIKARVAAGDQQLGREFLDSVEPLIYSTTLDFSAVEVMSATRERINEKMAEKLAAKRGGSIGFDVKLARGGIRDIEFLVQCLQRLHGGRVPWVRHGGTLLALSRLLDKDLLSESEYGRLASAYQFLRNLEHRLQYDEDRQTHTLPVDPHQMTLLARRMPSTIALEPSREGLFRQLNAHLEEVMEIYDRVIHSQKPLYYGPATMSASASRYEAAAIPEYADDAQPLTALTPAPSSNLTRFLDQKAPALAAVLAASGLRRGFRSFEHFLERVFAVPELLNKLNSDPLLAANTIDVFEHSPFFAEQLIRWPEMIEELHQASVDCTAEAAELANAGDLRRFFRREMLRIQSESICLRAPIFETLSRTSALADAVIGAAYRLAVGQTVEQHPPAGPDYQPQDQMMVIALGRLGMREFDLASDADLIFVLPDRESAELSFWTHAAERIVDLITAYTGEGTLFAVDTRLRPNGREGALVQSEESYKEYFASKAEAWEGISYMKARAVAGDAEHSTEFLNKLQEVDWRHYGQSGRSKKDLRQMRIRLEKEQGSSNPLKGGRGGYYDIDFSLMYLRLKSAGIFFKVLNTPQRIDIIEKMGHLDRADAEFLQDAATFYRAVDHGLRLLSGHAEGKLPNSDSQLETLTELVARWTPDRRDTQPLKTELAAIQVRTRELFDRLFG